MPARLAISVNVVNVVCPAMAPNWRHLEVHVTPRGVLADGLRICENIDAHGARLPNLRSPRVSRFGVRILGAGIAALVGVLRRLLLLLQWRRRIWWADAVCDAALPHVANRRYLGAREDWRVAEPKGGFGRRATGSNSDRTAGDASDVFIHARGEGRCRTSAGPRERRAKSDRIVEFSDMIGLLIRLPKRGG